MKTSLGFLILFMALGSLSMMAGATGSIFSGLGFGVLEDVNSSRAVGMGNAGLALEDSNTINFANPALLSTLRRARVSIGGYFSRQWMRDPNASDTDDWAQAEYFGLALPISTGWGLGIFMAPYSRVEYKYAWNGTLISPWPGVNPAPYLVTKQGIGGLTRAAVNLAWAPGPNVRVGVGGSVIWGDVQEYFTSIFNAPGYLDVQYTTSKQYRAFSGNLGLLIKPTPNLAIGVTFEPQVPLHEDSTFSYTAGDSTVISQQEYGLPARYSLGASYQLSPRWLTVAQMAYGAWANLNNLPWGSSHYRNSLDLSLGAEWTPGAWDNENFFRRMQYRFGLRRESSYILSNHNGVDLYTVTGGIGYPFHQGLNRLDLGFEFGSRGSLNTNGGQENTFKLRLGLNLGETWFQRVKRPWES